MTAHSFILGHLGTDVTAAYSVTSVAQQLIQCLTQGISGGAGIIIGQLLGENLLDEAKNMEDNIGKLLLCVDLSMLDWSASLDPWYTFFM